MPKGATLVNTARKEVIDEEGLMRALTEREDLKYTTDIAAAVQPELDEKFGKRVFATAKKMGAETAEANLNAGLAAARQIVDFFTTGCTRFQVNKGEKRSLSFRVQALWVGVRVWGIPKTRFCHLGFSLCQQGFVLPVRILCFGIPSVHLGIAVSDLAF